MAHWDAGSAAVYSYALYDDPNRVHSAVVVAPLSGQPSVSSSAMPDNAWIDFTVNTDAGAQAPSGNYFYLLRVQLTTPLIPNLNAFKIRTNGANVGGSSLFPTPQPFSYIANLAGNGDAKIVYPAFPSVTPTTYDGTFDFYFDEPVSQDDITVWDGDFDYGKFDGSVRDTDDPDTPDAPFLPAWATADTVPEGIAVGLSGSTGNPPDDGNPAGAGLYLVKPPSVHYDLIFPDGRIFANNDPSGNLEWEQFKISTAPFDRSQMDYHTDNLIPPGIFRLHIQGVDMQNLDALLLPGRAVCVSDAGVPCVPLHPFLVGDTVFVDANQNGVQDPGEPGIQGVEVDLFDANNVLIARTNTDANGHYSFEVEAFTYTVTIPPSNYGNSAEPGVLFGYTATTSQQCQVTIVDGNIFTCDFGFSLPGAVGDRVWNDSNGNGIQDPGEPGINGVPVSLYGAADNLIGSDTTNGDGNYLITNVPAGTYTVRVDDTALPGGLTPTYDLDGVATPNAAAVTLASGQTRTDVDFGYQGNASIGDRVWSDVNGNGVQDPGEPGIPGVTVQLQDDSGNPILNTVTGVDGHYSFDHLPEGTYNVQIDITTLPAGAIETYDFDGLGTPDAVLFIFAEAGTNNTDIDFGYRLPAPATGSIGDRVWNDVNGDGVQDPSEAGLNGVTVQLYDGTNTLVGTTTTGGDGNYTFSHLPAGTYTVRIVPASLPPGVAETYDLDGVGTQNAATLTLAAAENRTDVDFGYQGTASVGDRVWLDSNGNGVQDAGEAGINGVQVQLLDAANNVLATATTSGDGNYSFSRLNGGNYSVRVTPPAGVAETYDLDGVVTANVASFSLNPGDSRTDVDFGYRYTGSVGDRVWLDSNGKGTQDPSEPGINGVTVQLLDSSNRVVVGTAITSGDGNYTFNNLAPGTYTVQVSNLPAGLTETYDLDGLATLNRATFQLATGQNRTDVDFGYRYSGSVGDRVWLDTNGNGVQETGEAGINNVTVQLLSSSNTVIATTVTSGNGNYSFIYLPAGTYTVKIAAASLPAGVVQAFDLDGVATANQATFALGAGQVRTDVDFGYRNMGSVGDRVWLDSNGNGVQDPGETGIPGVTVQLLQGNTVIATTTTGSNGSYLFSNLSAGSYSIRVTGLESGLVPTYDLDGIATPGFASFALAAAQNRTDVDFGYEMSGCALAADVSPVYGASVGGHAFYFPGMASDFVFTPNPGGFTLNGGGTAHLTGSLWSISDPTRGFNVDVQFSGMTNVPPPGSPKKELQPSAYKENGGPVDTSTWSYFTDFTGTITGSGAYAGSSMTITRTGPAFQIGIGANGKNLNFGGSGWFLWTVTHQPFATVNNMPAAGMGDINIDMNNCAGLSSVGNRIWLDSNGNGIQDVGEVGINGVTVQILDSTGAAVGSIVTSGDGNYTLGGMPAGTYTVNVLSYTLPAGMRPTYDLDGTVSANRAMVTMTTNRTDVNFGYRH